MDCFKTAHTNRIKIQKGSRHEIDMKTQFDNPLYSFIVYTVSILFCLVTGYILIQSIEVISTDEHWRFTYSLVSFLIAMTLLWALGFSSIYKKFLATKEKRSEEW
ncbi:hypothetical protein DYD21_07645 [Rhodohalobacter sp. SW132]|nr:hypothetical protein DYD21_07645 [Rhodohalobacter sp. SW132]